MRNAFKLLPVFVVLLMFSCGGDDTPAVIPTVEFSHERSIVEVGDEVSFVSTHTDASEFSWEFGDGATATDQNPTHTYSETGEFTVTLTVTSTTGDIATSTSTVTVGSRWIVAFEVQAIPFTDDNGDPWDEDGGPDLFFGFAPTSEPDIRLYDFGEDLTEADFPDGGSLPESDQRELTNEDWLFLFVDNDPPFENLNESQTMGGFRFNPALAPADVRDFEQGLGRFTVESSGFSFVIFYAIRNQ